MVPGKPLAIISLTGHVWHPMGKPRGSARSSSALAERNPAAAEYVAALLRNSLLEIADIGASSLQSEHGCRNESRRTHYSLARSPYRSQRKTAESAKEEAVSIPKLDCHRGA